MRFPILRSCALCSAFQISFPKLCRPVPAALALGSFALIGFNLAGCARGGDNAGDTDLPLVVPRATLPLNAVAITPSTLAKWPWQNSKKEELQRGVTHWQTHQSDGTSLDLLRFDFKINPRLKFELYAQDEDDKKPFDNIVDYWAMGVGQATKHLNGKFSMSKKGTVVAAWNGPFFGYHSKNPAPKTYSGQTAFHLAPLVLNGKVSFNRVNHRWSFGVKYVNQKPQFKVFHLPGRQLLEREFDLASGSTQCLLLNGKPLKVEPFPLPGAAFKIPPVPSTPQEAGHIPNFDHAKFSRASIGWSKDSSKLFLILVRESNADNEMESIRAFRKGEAQSNGWTVLDLQNFWISLHKIGWVESAINSDAGDVGQLAYRLPGGEYSLVAPRGDVSAWERKNFDAGFKGAPQGGALMYFYVRDESL